MTSVMKAFFPEQHTIRRCVLSGVIVPVGAVPGFPGDEGIACAVQRDGSGFIILVGGSVVAL